MSPRHAAPSRRANVSRWPTSRNVIAPGAQRKRSLRCLSILLDLQGMGDFQLNRGLVVNNVFQMKIAFSIVLSAAMLFSSSSMAQTRDKVVYGTASRVGLAN